MQILLNTCENQYRAGLPNSALEADPENLNKKKTLKVKHKALHNIRGETA